MASNCNELSHRTQCNIKRHISAIEKAKHVAVGNNKIKELKAELSILMAEAKGNDVDTSEASQSESGNLDVDSEVISMGDSDIVVPPVISVPASAPSSRPPPPLQITEATAFDSSIFPKAGGI
ncbi:hypothetical protein B0H14DRAFT_2601636 [Mycena olivaceomarginata]|nr:hypothetical protein B0H14DRAFT_2601636 [Mycena olivaceomarginata]